MNRRRYYLISCAVILYTLTLGFTSLNYSQDNDKKTTLTIRLKITDSQGHWAEGGSNEGEVITRVDMKTGIGYGFTPFVQDRNAGLVQVKLSRVTENAGQVQMIEEVAIASIKLGESQQMGEPPFTVKVVAIEENVKDQAVASVVSESTMSLATTRCCVDCDGERVCATCVALTDCACCCCCSRGCCAVCNR